jgi:hypothetical protein
VKACVKVPEERGSREGFYHLKDNASILKKFLLLHRELEKAFSCS